MLSLKGTAVTAQGIAELKRAHPDLRIDLCRRHNHPADELDFYSQDQRLPGSIGKVVGQKTLRCAGFFLLWGGFSRKMRSVGVNSNLFASGELTLWVWCLSD